MADLTQIYGPFYGGMMMRQGMNDQSALNQNQALQGNIGLLSTMARQMEQNKLLAEQVNIAKLEALKKQALYDLAMNAGQPAQQALSEGAAQGDVGPTVTNAERMGGLMQRPQSGVPGSQFSPQQWTALGFLDPGVSNALVKQRESFLPKMEFHGGQAVDMRSVPAGTVIPQTNPQGFSHMTVRDPSSPLGYRVVATPGAAEVFQQQQDIAEGAKARRDLVTVPATSPNAPPTYRTREQIVNETRAPSALPGNQLQIVTPDERTAEQTALDLYNRGVRNFRVDAGAPSSLSAGPASAGGVAAGMSPTQTANVKGLEREKEGEAAYLINEVYKPAQDADRQASRDIPRLQFLLRMNLDTGRMAPAKELLYGWAKDLGLGTAAADQWLSNAQEFKAFMSDRVLQKQLLQKGPQTESDARRMEMTMSNLTNTAEANKFLLSVELAQAKREREYAQFLRNYRLQRNSLANVEDAWASNAAGQKSLFDDPVLKPWAGAEMTPRGAGASGTTGTDMYFDAQGRRVK